MRRDDAYLFDILEAARIVMQYVSGKSLDEFLQDLQCQDAVVRRFILIGEAARRISPETQGQYPQIPWHEMISMRNLVVHEYEDIDLVILWDTAHQDLPKLIQFLEKEISETGEPWQT
jgi:uncharacterized protein with HEPN domain